MSNINEYDWEKVSPENSGSKESDEKESKRLHEIRNRDENPLIEPRSKEEKELMKKWKEYGFSKRDIAENIEIRRGKK